MSTNKIVDILQLTMTDGIGPVSFFKYLQKYGNVENTISALSEKKKLCSRAKVEDEIATAEKLGVKLITYDDEYYPQKLREINDMPPIIYAKGNIDLLNYPIGISIVGARNASVNGRKIASRIAYDLTRNDVLVVSGMARGIDSSAHKGALYAKDQKGPTIAVLGTGVDVVYPPENKELYQMICQQGLVISELSLGSIAQVGNFPRRNRIISALTTATLVVESSLHSGSLITARLALEQGKDVFAVPGSPLENRSQGPNQLIRDGAILTESADDILNVLSIDMNTIAKNKILPIKPLDKVENNVNISDIENTVVLPEAETNSLLDLIAYEGVDIDELLRNCGLSQAEFFSQLLELEFSGKVYRQAGNKIARVK